MDMQVWGAIFDQKFGAIIIFFSAAQVVWGQNFWPGLGGPEFSQEGQGARSLDPLWRQRW